MLKPGSERATATIPSGDEDAAALTRVNAPPRAAMTEAMRMLTMGVVVVSKVKRVSSDDLLSFIGDQCYATLWCALALL